MMRNPQNPLAHDIAHVSGDSDSLLNSLTSVGSHIGKIITQQPAQLFCTPDLAKFTAETPFTNFRRQNSNLRDRDVQDRRQGHPNRAYQLQPEKSQMYNFVSDCPAPPLLRIAAPSAPDAQSPCPALSLANLPIMTALGEKPGCGEKNCRQSKTDPAPQSQLSEPNSAHSAHGSTYCDLKSSESRSSQERLYSQSRTSQPTAESTPPQSSKSPSSIRNRNCPAPSLRQILSNLSLSLSLYFGSQSLTIACFSCQTRTAWTAPTTVIRPAAQPNTEHNTPSSQDWVQRQSYVQFLQFLTLFGKSVSIRDVPLVGDQIVRLL